MKTILITAYAVNPYKGSEDGTGWNMVRKLAETQRVILYTRKNNVSAIRSFLDKEAGTAWSVNIKLHGFDLPKWVLWLKKNMGERGYVAYFYFWQLFLALHIKRKKVMFDVAHALNFHSDNVPHFLWILKKPVVWGPIGHHAKVPAKYILKQYGLLTYVKDRFYNLVKWSLRNLDPFFRIAVHKSSRILVINSEISKAIRAKSEKVIVLSAVAADVVYNPRKVNKTFNVLMVGRFHYTKGFDIALRAFAHFKNYLSENQLEQVQLTLVGNGNEKSRLQKLAKELEIEKQVKWIDWVDKSHMAQIYQEATVFLFPSHEGAGMVVPEAMSFGLPVICFDNAGPGELAAKGSLKVKYSTYEKSVADFSDHLMDSFSYPSRSLHLGSEGRTFQQEKLTWEHKENEILSVYHEIFEKRTRLPKSVKSIAVFHPSSELYGADRIMVNALKAIPEEIRKHVYLLSEGPLMAFLEAEVKNVQIHLCTNMPIIYRKIFSVTGVFHFLRNWFKFRRFLKEENKKYHFKSAYVNTLSASFILPLLKSRKIPAYVHVHEIIERPRIIGYITAFLADRYACQVVCVSKAVRENLQKFRLRLGFNALVLHNGIESIKTLPGENKNDRIHFYLFGRIMPKKGQWYLLESLVLLPVELRSKAKFVIMGGVLKGQEQLLEDLKLKILELDLSDCVEIVKFSKNISSAMQHADVCLVPSLMKDPFPTTVLEALSAGRPVIATNHGGASEAIIHAENGYLMAPGDTSQFAKYLIHFIRNRSEIELMRAKAKESFRKFTIESFNQKWLRFNVSNEFI